MEKILEPLEFRIGVKIEYQAVDESYVATTYTIETSINGETERLALPPLQSPIESVILLPIQRSFLERHLPTKMIEEAFYLIETAAQTSLYQTMIPSMRRSQKDNLISFKKRVQGLYGVRAKDFSEIKSLETRGGQRVNRKLPFRDESDYKNFAVTVEKALPLWRFVRERAKQAEFDMEDARMIKQRLPFKELSRECQPVPDNLIQLAFNPDKKGFEVRALGLALSHAAHILDIKSVALETLNAAYKRGKAGKAK